MPKITDKEFGEITVRRTAQGGNIRISVAPDGNLRISSSRFTPLMMVRRSINSSRPTIRKLLEKVRGQTIYRHGQRVGKEHLMFTKAASKLTVKREGSIITVFLPDDMEIEDPDIQSLIRAEVIKALRKEAKRHLPKRLQHQAQRMSASYKQKRFSHASTRWGSYSSSGTLSLNIALMKLPYELIDYVIIHELAHTKYLNHSPEFWAEVANFDVDFKKHRTQLKDYQPSI